MTVLSVGTSSPSATEAGKLTGYVLGSLPSSSGNIVGRATISQCDRCRRYSTAARWTFYTSAVAQRFRKSQCFPDLSIDVDAPTSEEAPTTFCAGDILRWVTSRVPAREEDLAQGLSGDPEEWARQCVDLFGIVRPAISERLGVGDAQESLTALLPRFPPPLANARHRIETSPRAYTRSVRRTGSGLWEWIPTNPPIVNARRSLNTAAGQTLGRQSPIPRRAASPRSAQDEGTGPSDNHDDAFRGEGSRPIRSTTLTPGMPMFTWEWQGDRGPSLPLTGPFSGSGTTTSTSASASQSQPTVLPEDHVARDSVPAAPVAGTLPLPIVSPTGSSAGHNNANSNIPPLPAASEVAARGPSQQSPLLAEANVRRRRRSLTTLFRPESPLPVVSRSPLRNPVGDSIEDSERAAVRRRVTRDDTATGQGRPLEMVGR